MFKYLGITLFFLSSTTSSAQNLHEKSLTELNKMLNGGIVSNFKKAVFIIENVFFDGNLLETTFESDLSVLLILTKARYKNLKMGYVLKDSLKIRQYASLFKVLTDTSIVTSAKGSVYFMPFSYDFEDMFGEKDWSNMFVTKLLATHKGNCHSMPYLYKILCDELGIPCHLALAPNHIYIKHRSEKVGWYNTELTSGSFPIDAWIMASGYIPLEAIQNGIYMDALDDKKCITLCVYDLAKGFDRKYPDNDGTFIIKCCDLALEHFPNFINAMILKAETRKRQFELLMKAKNISTPKELRQQKEGKELWNDMNSLYAQIHKLGYRAMPEKMYVDWLVSLKKEREKYGNKQVMEMNKY